MKILHSSDWHIGNFPGPEIDGKNLRAHDTIKCIKFLTDTANNEKPDIAIVAGDIFHQARVWADRGLSEVKDAIGLISALSQICPVIVMRGTPNHDGNEQFAMLNSAFESNHKVFVTTQPETIFVAGMVFAILPGFDRGGYRAKFPGLSKEDENYVFTEELGKTVLGLKASCAEQFPNQPHILVSHYTIPGCNVESGQTQFFSQFEPVIAPDVLDAAGFDLVCFGHIHRPQKLTSCKNAFYSGAVNAMNFNDEEQERGFWMHELGNGNVESNFIKTPYREFLTLRLDNGAVNAFNTVAGEDTILIGGTDIFGDIPTRSFVGKIVRVIYSCTDEVNKAFNRSLMEKCLYEHGAFWVSEISPEQINIGTTKTEMSDLINPETNLITYLNERGESDERIGAVVESARPIISEALAGAITSRLTGIFSPLEIEVKNYRNYAEEVFDFRNINFCTINGKNGSGKSSLFMDAILDCLYEEPREGDLTGWIRADEKARSGSISFSFAIGEQTFRVTRTRAKSGKATLNLSELVSDEWVDRSHEKLKDTQNTIEGVLGMDSMTFRSCALIMQDQYGLFMQADKEDRMSVLGNILGLGIYDDMEQLALNKLRENRSEISKRKTIVETLSREITDERELVGNLAVAKQDAELLLSEKANFEKTRDELKSEAEKRKEVQERINNIRTDIASMKESSAELLHSITSQNVIINESENSLTLEETINEKAAEYPKLLEREKELLQELAATTSQIAGCNGVQAEAEQIRRNINSNTTEIESAESRIMALEEKVHAEDELRNAADEHKKILELLAEQEEKLQKYLPLSDEINTIQSKYTIEQSNFEQEAKSRKERIVSLEAKTTMLTSSGCPNPDTANCTFLKDAQTAAAELEPYRKKCTEWKESEMARLDQQKHSLENLRAQLEAIQYDPEKRILLLQTASNLEQQTKDYEQLTAVRAQITLLNEKRATLAISTSSLQERLTKLTESAERERELIAAKAELDVKYEDISARIAKSAEWVEREKQLPIIKERMATAKVRIAELQQEVDRAKADIAAKEQKLCEEQALFSASDVDVRLSEVESAILQNDSKISSIRMDIGRYTQRLDDIEKKKTEITTEQAEIKKYANKASIYETLKCAFGQDGIPHNIIRAVLPTLSATANSILGTMTGGKMGVDFVTDRVLKSNSKKEIPTLDIVIEEYGKDTLPYLSKSGGERVKASLSVILSLAEAKSSQAGVQLGMLFIDEPPFLDADGVGAYCDALEAIQRRYSSLKVMAITHDPAFKARFPQSIDIIKTESGSRVEAA